ncbi:adenylyltransferase/cytidyltransferase family protein [Candidatus Uhrbacteria bacterium]|nr:adenylyltransferase/cytidyltransferase family protein [Candidatus Uhrbacteria bacterium]
MSSHTILVFGTFDGIHAGHVSFLRQARLLGDRLVVVVARDITVQVLKGRPPQHTEADRLDAVRALSLVDEAVLGDETLGEYAVVRQVGPETIAIGHDQDALSDHLTSWLSAASLPIPMRRLSRLAPSPPSV